MSKLTIKSNLPFRKRDYLICWVYLVSSFAHLGFLQKEPANDDLRELKAINTK